jgi:hypothetical protein
MTANDLFIALDSATAGRRASRFVEPERHAGPSLLERIAARLRAASAPNPASVRA